MSTPVPGTSRFTLTALMNDIVEHKAKMAEERRHLAPPEVSTMFKRQKKPRTPNGIHCSHTRQLPLPSAASIIARVPPLPPGVFSLRCTEKSPFPVSLPVIKELRPDFDAADTLFNLHHSSPNNIHDSSALSTPCSSSSDINIINPVASSTPPTITTINTNRNLLHGQPLPREIVENPETAPLLPLAHSALLLEHKQSLMWHPPAGACCGGTDATKRAAANYEAYIQKYHRDCIGQHPLLPPMVAPPASSNLDPSDLLSQRRYPRKLKL